jgi:uncharacterized protein YecT (DUF1311 family)
MVRRVGPGKGEVGVRKFISALLLLTVPHCALAMEFRTTRDPLENIRVIMGEGPIISGDASRLEGAIKGAERDKYGNYHLYLNSPGGEVEAAFEMVAVMDREDFTAIVSSGARCASACAAVVYLSARHHEIVGDGLIGIHSCYSGKDRRPSSYCNERIVQNATDHGTSYGAIGMWQKTIPPDEVAWIGKDVACNYGLCGPPTADFTLAKPSFDCAKAKLPAEKAICSDQKLARLEAQVANRYRDLMRTLPVEMRDKLRSEQRKWLLLRNSCEEATVVQCVVPLLRSRQSALWENWR